MSDVLVIGGGPAGLMAAETVLDAGYSVTLADQKPTVGRKFLMAGKSGLNLTKQQAPEPFLEAYTDPGGQICSAVGAFGPQEVCDWAEALGQTLFTGSTGRVFPQAMKASPLLRAWLRRLAEKGLDLRTRHRWAGWDENGAALFEAEAGPVRITSDATILALGGASWPHLGSDGKWATLLEDQALPFAPSNVGVLLEWSDHMVRHFGHPLKSVEMRAGAMASRGEVVLTRTGLEGGGLYPLTPALRAGAELIIDLRPDVKVEALQERLQKARKGESLSNRLRKAAGLTPVKSALLREFADMQSPLAPQIKALKLPYRRVGESERAISTVGGLDPNALTRDLMLKSRPGVFAAGEMIDWDAPTGGYLITACLATGRRAGQAAADWLKGQVA